jgi:hypothetical protein
VEVDRVYALRGFEPDVRSPSVTRISGAGKRRPDVSSSKLQISCSAPSGKRNDLL